MLLLSLHGPASVHAIHKHNHHSMFSFKSCQCCSHFKFLPLQHHPNCFCSNILIILLSSFSFLDSLLFCLSFCPFCHLNLHCHKKCTVITLTGIGTCEIELPAISSEWCSLCFHFLSTLLLLPYPLGHFFIWKKFHIIVDMRDSTYSFHISQKSFSCTATLQKTPSQRAY